MLFAPSHDFPFASTRGGVARRPQAKNHASGITADFALIFAGIGLQTPVAVADRPVTQQGLSGMRTGTGKGPQRQYQDKARIQHTLSGDFNLGNSFLNKAYLNHFKSQSAMECFDSFVNLFLSEFQLPGF